MEPKTDGFQKNILFQGAIFKFHFKLWDGTFPFPFDQQVKYHFFKESRCHTQSSQGHAPALAMLPFLVEKVDDYN